MSSDRNEGEGGVTGAAKAFWKTRQFWFMILSVILSGVVIGYLLGSWYATAAYREQSESRKLILAQCITTNDKLTSQLAALGDKTADALDKLTTERK